MRWTATIATNQIDQDNERFSDEALDQMAVQALFAPVTRDFALPKIGHVRNAVRSKGELNVEIDGNLTPGLYVVPAITFDPKECTVEDGVRVYHRVRLTSLSITDDPSDLHLTPLREIEP